MKKIISAILTFIMILFAGIICSCNIKKKLTETKTIDQISNIKIADNSKNRNITTVNKIDSSKTTRVSHFNDNTIEIKDTEVIYSNPPVGSPIQIKTHSEIRYNVDKNTSVTQQNNIKNAHQTTLTAQTGHISEQKNTLRSKDNLKTVETKKTLTLMWWFVVVGAMIIFALYFFRNLNVLGLIHTVFTSK